MWGLEKTHQSVGGPALNVMIYDCLLYLAGRRACVELIRFYEEEVFLFGFLGGLMVPCLVCGLGSRILIGFNLRDDTRGTW